MFGFAAIVAGRAESGGYVPLVAIDMDNRPADVVLIDISAVDPLVILPNFSDTAN